MASSAPRISEQNDADKKKELFLVDGSGFIFRAFYALPPLTNPAGTPVGAVLGFTNMLVKLLQDFEAPYLAVIFDAARENFRYDIYKEYKANRDETPPDLIPQFPLIREATDAFDIPRLELEGYEADDLIATYARLAKEQDIKVTIVSSDKDLMQLIDDTHIRMYDPMKSKFIGPDDVVEKFGVRPERVIDVQALAGDSVDNVPGVPGIGIKTAAALIEEFGDLEALLVGAATIKQNKRREKLIEHAEDARISYKLVRLEDHVPIETPLADLKIHQQDPEKLGAFLSEHGFKSVLSRMNMATPAQKNIPSAPAQENKKAAGGDWGQAVFGPPIAENDYTLIQDVETLKQWMEYAEKEGLLAIDTETTSLTPTKAELVGISIACHMGEAAYIPIRHKQAQTDLLSVPEGNQGNMTQLPLQIVIELMKPVLENPAIIKIGQNMKYDSQMLAQNGVMMAPLDDTMLMSYCLDGTDHGHSMDELSQLYFDHKPVAYKDIVGSGKNQITFDYVGLDDALGYAAEDADITLRLYHALNPRLAKEGKKALYEHIERPMIRTIAEMELKGIKVDPAVLKDLSTYFSRNIEKAEEKIFELAGTQFNIGSPKQIGEVLFDQMGLTGGKKTKTGSWSTNADVLEKLAAEGHEIVQHILDWRGLSKLKSTYSDALQNQINPKTGRVHTSYSLAATTTGRLASSEPNLQNIPIRTEDGRKIRTAFIAEKGYKLISIDYSQVELRLIAEIADIPALKKAFQDGRDIHALTASEVFDIPLDDITPEIRRRAKAINFGIIYGISAFGLARQLDCPIHEAKSYIERYFTRFPELLDYMERMKEQAKKTGFVETIFGRKCSIHGAQDNNQARRAFAERQAINAPIQGAAADIIKLAMTRVASALKEQSFDATLLLQVHDELILEIKESDVEPCIDFLKQEMEQCVSLSIPLIAEGGSGDNWSEAH
jgi:DNA polymerase-1